MHSSLILNQTITVYILHEAAEIDTRCKDRIYAISLVICWDYTVCDNEIWTSNCNASLNYMEDRGINLVTTVKLVKALIFQIVLYG